MRFAGVCVREIILFFFYTAIGCTIVLTKVTLVSRYCIEIPYLFAKRFTERNMMKLEFYETTERWILKRRR